MSYDGNGNTLSYDADGSAGPLQPRSFTYDAENRPVSITSNGATTSFQYGGSGERTKKTSLASQTWYIADDGELKVDAANPSGLITSWIADGVKREGTATDVLVKDVLGTNRISTRIGQFRVQFGPGFRRPLVGWDGSGHIPAYFTMSISGIAGLLRLSVAECSPFLGKCQGFFAC